MKFKDLHLSVIFISLFLCLAFSCACTVSLNCWPLDRTVEKGWLGWIAPKTTCTWCTVSWALTNRPNLFRYIDSLFFLVWYLWTSYILHARFFYFIGFFLLYSSHIIYIMHPKQPTYHCNKDHFPFLITFSSFRVYLFKTLHSKYLLSMLWITLISIFSSFFFPIYLRCSILMFCNSFIK